MVRRSVLAIFAATAIVLGFVVVSTPAGAVIDSAAVVPSPNLGTSYNYLYSVSCVSASWCVAVGYYNNGSGDQTLVEQWNSASWTVIPSPSPGDNNILYSVSCVSASSCVAVGNYNNNSAAQTLVEQWNGASWRVIPSPNLGTSYNYLLSVSCVTADFCVATGGEYEDGSGFQTLVEQWNGASWTVVPSPTIGTGSNFLNSVSCSSAVFCVAAGSYYNVSENQTLVEQWNGASWMVVPSPNLGTNQNFLNSVSCVTADFCIATGSYRGGSGDQTLVEKWDGTSWTVTPSPNTGTYNNSLNSVSCVAVSFCVATGIYTGAAYVGPPHQTLVEQWDGASWTVTPSANTGTDDNVLASVSCVTVSSCVAVGYSDNRSVDQTLVLSLTGAEPPTTTTTTSSDPVAPAFTG